MRSSRADAYAVARRQRYFVVFAGVVIGLVMVAVWLTDWPSRWVAIAMAAGVAVAAIAVVGPTLLLNVRLRGAVARGDAPTLRRLANSLPQRFRSNPAARDVIESIEVASLLIEERWDEARTRLQKVNLDDAPTLVRCYTLNNLAWALAHLGEPRRAIELATEVLELGAGGNEELRSHAIGTLGCACGQANEHSEAVRLIRDALVRGSTPFVASIRYYYLGFSLRALGKVDEARDAFRRSIAAMPSSSWAARSKQALASL